jgi:hypothetical protein
VIAAEELTQQGLRLRQPPRSRLGGGQTHQRRSGARQCGRS